MSACETPKPSVVAPAHGISLQEAAQTWAKIGLLSFGGPVAQIAMMHRILVDEKRWISEERFLHALNYCMLIPGPEAQQLACYVGWLLHRTAGGIIAGALFVLPGFIAILALSLAYAAFSHTPWIQALLYGLKPAIIAIVAAAVVRIGTKALKNAVMVGIAAAAFLAMFVFAVPFPYIIVLAAVIGVLGNRWYPGLFLVFKGHASSTGAVAILPPVIADDALVQVKPSLRHALATAGIWLTLWWAPVIGLMIVVGPNNIFSKEGVFFSEAAVVTFGGAYSVLAFLAQQAVQVYHWVSTTEMMDGLGMAETTPGPLIMVTQYVGFMGAFRDHGTLNPYLAGVLASLLVTWVTFIPCYLYIFLGAPWIEYLRGNQRLTAVLSSITAAVVGVVVNLGCWFALHTLFKTVRAVHAGPFHLTIPVWATIDLAALVLALGASVAMMYWRTGMIRTLAACLVLGMAWSLLMR